LENKNQFANLSSQIKTKEITLMNSINLEKSNQNHKTRNQLKKKLKK
jgi:hypothetical protein